MQGTKACLGGLFWAKNALQRATSLSSSGPGHGPLTAVTGVQIPLGTPSSLRRAMTDPQRPVGKLFSEVYLPKGEPLSDSTRLRHRLFTFISKNLGTEYWARLTDKLELRLGLNRSWPNYFKEAAIRDVLDAITITYNFIFDFY